MREFLFQYEPVNPTTWVYLSSLLTIGLYVKFSRLWSMRNLDLLGLICLSPGLLMVYNGDQAIEQAGYIWLFVVGGLFIIRLLLDPIMVRRPLLEPNLSPGGLTFIGIALFVFLMGNVVNGKFESGDLAGPRAAEQQRAMQTASSDDNSLTLHGPGLPLLLQLPAVITQPFYADDQKPTEAGRQEARWILTMKIATILAHLAIVLGMVVIGYLHFDNIRTGVAAATLYLLLPYTAQRTGHLDHVLPAALLLWAIVAYRRPLIAGMLIGLAIGSYYYPMFLLPLWIGFYWQRGLGRFLFGVLSTLALVVASLAFTSADFPHFLMQAKQMFGWTLPAMDYLQGFWKSGYDPVYRLPVLAAFVVVATSLALWPPQKNLGTLLSCSAAVMIGTQFWHAHGGGLYIAWYLPLMLLTIFRPNLEDRVALSVLGESWFPRRRPQLAGAEKAA